MCLRYQVYQATPPPLPPDRTVDSDKDRTHMIRISVGTQRENLQPFISFLRAPVSLLSNRGEIYRGRDDQ